MATAIEGDRAATIGQIDSRPRTHTDSIAVEVRGVSKRFDGIQALNGVSFDVTTGTIHALVGANGAGKSTLLGIVAGRLEASEGELRFFGRPVNFSSPRQAKQAGICAIYQELMIVPALSAKANVFLGQELSRHGLLAEIEMDQQYQRLCERLRVKIDPSAQARALSVADQQVLEIMRGLQSQARLMLFDEPTTALAPAERDALFRTMRDLRREGATMILVSHNLDEVLDVADAVTVFRDGRVVASAPRSEWSKRKLVRAMIGRDLSESDLAHQALEKSLVEPIISVRGLSLPGVLEDIDIDIRPGEIIGIGGLVGSGRTSLLRAIAGLEPDARGEMTIDGSRVAWPKSPRQAIVRGIGLVPEDRKNQGLVASMSAVDNISMADFGKAARAGIIRDGKLFNIARPVATAFGFDPERLAAEVRTLSGGNQQKVLLARWGYRVPRVLLIDEPTRGIDIGAKEEILRTVRTLATNGLALVVVSSELEEIVAISDRVLVLSRGRVSATLDTSQSFNVDTILQAAFGV